jgi:flagellar biosynthetic protein FlhB
MSDFGEKVFEPTQSRIAKAKREGNSPRASEFASTAACAAAALATCAVVPSIGDAGAIAIRSAASGVLPLAGCLAVVGLALAPIAAGATAAAIAGVVQSGGLHVVSPRVKFERVNLVEGLKRMFSREAATHGARACLAFGIATCALVPSFRDVLVASTATNGVRTLATSGWAGAEHVVAATLAVGAVFAVGEYAVARSAWFKKLRMSFAEFKREMKENDGDPMVRSRRKSLHRSLIRGSLSGVKDASFVVVNPTHVAIALEYRPPDVPVPNVLVRAVDEGALRVRELAFEYRVPVIENIPLARALFADSQVGSPISSVHYVAVAEIVAALSQAGVLRQAQDETLW